MGSIPVIVLATFGAVVLLIVGPYYFFVVRDEAASQDMLRRRIRTGGGGGTLRALSAVGLLKEVERFSVIGPLNQLLAGSNAIAANLRDVIQFSGLKVTAGQIVLGSGCLALLVYILVSVKTGMALVSLGAGLCFGLLPYAALRFMRARRLSKFEEQFPEAVDLLARTLRAGHAFTTGLGIAAEELPQPVAGEFKLLHDQQNYGLPLNDGLKNLAKRVPLIDARFFVTAVLTQREAGGNLAEVLDNLSAVIRERFRIKRQLRVITAHGRMTGMVLAGLPPALALYMFVAMPEHFQVLIEDPAGIRMILVAIGLQIFGAFLIYKISNVEY